MHGGPFQGMTHSVIRDAAILVAIVLVGMFILVVSVP